MKTFIVSFNFNGVSYVRQVESVRGCLGCLLASSQVGNVENVTITKKSVKQS